MDFYAVLGIAPDVDQRSLRKAYLKRALDLHPDKQLPEDAAAAGEAFSKVKHAYDVLSNDEARKAYDEKRQAGCGLHKKRRTGDDGRLKEELARARVEQAKQHSSTRILKVSWARGLAYSLEKLQEIFEHFGMVEAVVLEEEGSALVLMSSETAANLATQGLGSGALQVVPMAAVKPARSKRVSRQRAPRRKQVWIPASCAKEYLGKLFGFP